MFAVAINRFHCTNAFCISDDSIRWMKKINKKSNMRDIRWPLGIDKCGRWITRNNDCWTTTAKATEYSISFNNYLIAGYRNYSSFWSHEEKVYVIWIQIISDRSTTTNEKTNRMIYISLQITVSNVSVLAKNANKKNNNNTHKNMKKYKFKKIYRLILQSALTWSAIHLFSLLFIRSENDSKEKNHVYIVWALRIEHIRNWLTCMWT